MKKLLVFFLISFLLVKFDSLFSQIPTIIQVDTIAINGMPLQPVLKVYINAPSGNLTLSRMDIKSYCEVFSDVDSVSIYRTTFNRFSRADYENDWISDVQSIMVKKKSFSPTDSIASFQSMTFPLQAGDNYIWILLDLAKKSVAGHYLKVKIPKESIIINSNSYPAEEQSSSEIPIRQVYFKEDFNNFNSSSKEPIGWTQECLAGCDYVGPYWQSQKGGYGSPDNEGNRNPNSAKSGTYNARLVHPYFTPYSILLKSKPIDLLLATKPTLTFYHAQMNWKKGGEDYIDSLSLFYRIGINGEWKSLSKYTLATPAGKWVKREIILPDEALNGNFYLGFKGTAQWGFGVCIDSIKIFEAGTEVRKIKTIITDHPYVGSAPQSSTNNPILRMNIRVKGNTGSIVMNSLTITSANTDDNDIKNAGVRLYSTSDSVFESPKLVGTLQSFSAKTITFGGLNKKIETGNNYFWITYDIANKATPDNILDLSIKPGDIIFTGAEGTWPTNELSPDGNRKVKQSLFFDDFETDKGWGLRGEFERGIPSGKGGKPSGGDAYGRPDPTYAFSNLNIMGTDLSTDGNYKNSLADNTADTATTPLIKAKYFKNTRFNFYRWLNIESQDSAVIEYKYTGENNWRFLWGSNQNEFQESNWSLQDFDTKNLLDRKDFRIRFRLGPTTEINRYSGWNIDYLFVTGDTIRYDAAVTKFIGPKSACSLTANEHLSVTVKNTGPRILTNFNIKASTDGGKTWITEVIPGPLALDDSIDYQFTTPSDLSKPAIYSIIVKVSNSEDNYSKNDSIVYKLTSIPTYSLPYNTSFENDTTFWSAGGLNSSWIEGDPNGDFIKKPSEGYKAWKTNNNGRYNLNEISYLESPCFSFSGVEKPIIQLQNSFVTEFQKDGATLEYSLDQGSTWNYVNGDTLQFNWKWYNDIINTFSDLKGWTGLIGGAGQPWQNTQRYFSEVNNQPKVKFRVAFKTNSTLTPIPREGIAIDEFRVYEAPFDAGVTSIDNLTTPACQYSNPTKLKVTVKNFGIKNMHENDTIIIGIKVNESAVVKDTFKLTTALNIKDTRQFTMNKDVNIANPGIYKIKAFVIEKYPAFYNTNNDTFKYELTVNPNPISKLPDTVYTARRDTLIVKAYHSDDYNYQWTYASTPASNTEELNAANTGYGDHYLTVENKITHCITEDTVNIKRLIPDIGVDKIISPITNCGYKLPEKPVVQLHNFGTDTVKVTKIIPVSIKLNKEPVLTENVKLSETLAPGGTVTVTLTSALNLLTAKTDTLKICTKLPYDDNELNDTTINIFEIHGYPNVFLGNDTTIKGKLSYDLKVPAGYKDVLWSDGITKTETFTIHKPDKYYVTVTDFNDCENSDTIKVHMIIHDLEMSKLISPTDACSQTETTRIKCLLKNAGTDTIQVAEPIVLYYQVGGGNIEQETITLTDMLKPDNTLEYTFNKTLDMSTSGKYDFKLKTLLSNDIQPLNDSILQTVEVFGNPKIDLGIDRIVQSLTYMIYPGKFFSYEWQDNSKDTSWVLSKDHHANNDEYWVTVSNEHGCTDRDTVKLYHFINDLAITGSSLTTANCNLSSRENITLTITNMGNTPLEKSFDIFYYLNGGAEVKDNFTFKGAAGASQKFTFNTPADLKAKGYYSFLFKIKMLGDVNPVNDTVTYATTVLGYPIVDFKAPNDTFMVKLPFTLDPGQGYPDYLWQDNSRESTFTVTKENYDKENTVYSVTVTDENGCGVLKTVDVIELLSDVAITNMNIPLENCTLPASTLAVTIKNNSNIALKDQEITLGYILNGGTPVNKQTSVSLAKGASKTIEFDEKVNMSEIKTHNMTISLTLADDANNNDNSSTYEIKVFGNPTNIFAVDTVKTSSFPLKIEAKSGFKVYKWNDNTSDSYLNVNAKGFYFVTVTDQNQCSAKDSVFVDFTTGVGSLEDKASIKLFPNPVSNYLHVTIHMDEKQDLMLDILNANGQVVYKTRFENMNEYIEDIDVSGFAKGSYFVRIYDNGSSVAVKKIVVK